MRTAKSFPGWISSPAWTPYTLRQHANWNLFRQSRRKPMKLGKYLLLALVIAGLASLDAGAGTFPDAEHSYPMNANEAAKLAAALKEGGQE